MTVRIGPAEEPTSGMSAPASAAVPVALLEGCRRLHWYRPEWCAVAVAAAGWLVLAGVAVAEPGHGVGMSDGHTWATAGTHAAVMAAAMMAPLVLPQVHHVATHSTWRRRYPAAAGFLAGYLSAWTVAGALLLLAGSAVAAAVGWQVGIVAAFVLAVSVALLPERRRRVRGCATTAPLAWRGWRADRDCVAYGLTTARRCVATCWPLMLAAMLEHGLVVMAGVTGVALLERRRPDLPRPVVPLLMAALGLAALVLSFAVPTHHHG